MLSHDSGPGIRTSTEGRLLCASQRLEAWNLGWAAGTQMAEVPSSWGWLSGSLPFPLLSSPPPALLSSFFTQLFYHGTSG